MADKSCIVVIDGTSTHYEQGYYDVILKSWKIQTIDANGDVRNDQIAETEVVAWGLPRNVYSGNAQSSISYECITPPRLIPEAADLYTQALLKIKNGNDATDFIKRICDKYLSGHNYGSHPDVLYLDALNDFVQHKGIPERKLHACLSANPDHPLALALLGAMHEEGIHEHESLKYYLNACLNWNEQAESMKYIDPHDKLYGKHKSPHDINDLMEEVHQFTVDRDWDQFHNGKDLALALALEAAELQEPFLWKNPEDVDVDKIKEELADVVNYALLIAYKYNLDICQIVRDKLKRNAEKYPIEKSKGSSKKYKEL